MTRFVAFSRARIATIVATVSLAVLAAAPLLSACGSGGQAADGLGASAPQPGSTTRASIGLEDSAALAPDFEGETLTGDRVSLSMYRGKPLVLAFMASW